MGYIDEFYKNLHFICYAPPVVVYADLGRAKLLQIADRCEVGRGERKAQLIAAKSTELGFSLLNNVKGKRLHDISKMSKYELEQELIRRNQQILPIIENYRGAQMVTKIAQSQCCRAFHMLHSCYTEKEIYYNTLHTDEIHVLARALQIENDAKLKLPNLCSKLLEYIEGVRHEKSGKAD